MAFAIVAFAIIMHSMTNDGATVRVQESSDAETELTVSQLDWLVILGGEHKGLHLRPAPVPSFSAEEWLVAA